MLKITVIHSRRVPNNLARAVSDGMAKLASQANTKALGLTSGSVSTAQLIRMGHPFGRRAVRPGRGGRGRIRGNLPRLPINKQTGDLQKSLILPIFQTARGFEYRLQFTKDYASFVLAPGGSRTTVARGFFPELFRMTQSDLRATVRYVVANAFK